MTCAKKWAWILMEKRPEWSLLITSMAKCRYVFNKLKKLYQIWTFPSPGGKPDEHLLPWRVPGGVRGGWWAITGPGRQVRQYSYISLYKTYNFKCHFLIEAIIFTKIFSQYVWKTWMFYFVFHTAPVPFDIEGSSTETHKRRFISNSVLSCSSYFLPTGSCATSGRSWAADPASSWPTRRTSWGTGWSGQEVSTALHGHGHMVRKGI